MKNILFIKTFMNSGIGASLPETDLFISASFIENRNPNSYDYTFFNVGYDYTTETAFTDTIKRNNFDIVLFSANAWETQNLHELCKIIKTVNEKIVVCVSGQLASIVKESLLKDKNIDVVIYGEPFVSFYEILCAVESNTSFENIEGICYRRLNNVVVNRQRPLYENVDDFRISNKIWDLVDIKKYSGSLSWNGLNKNKYYIPIISSFGCNFLCSYCTNRLFLGNQFRVRSTKSVVDEIEYLVNKFNIYEIHFFDAVFNSDINRSKELLKEIINRKIKISIAFPHGLRIDKTDEELIKLFKEAGVYKLTYAIETASTRLQKQIKKNIDLEKAKKIIELTAKQKIIVCGYFMLGFDTESEEEMSETIKYACDSDFDIASFFKYSPMYEQALKIYTTKQNLIDFSYFSNNLNNKESIKINYYILLAQRKFYLNFKRLFRLFIKSERKVSITVQIIKAISIILQGYIVSQLFYNYKKD